MAPRVVLDTNLFVAAGFNPRSHSARIVAAVAAGELAMVWSAATRGETLHVLGRIPPLASHDLAPLFRPERELPDADTSPYGFIPDPADRAFAALAVAAGAVLITSDAHLLDHRAALATPVLTPGAFLASHP